MFIGQNINKFLLVAMFLFANQILAAEDTKDYKQNKTIEQQEAPQPTSFGVLGAWGEFKVGSGDIKVLEVDAGVAKRAGLKVGDIVYGANGKKFEEYTNSVDDGGKGPQEGLGYAIEKSISNQSYKMTLMVKRRGKSMVLNVSIPSSIPPFSKTFPHNCARSELMLTRICKYLEQTAGPKVRWGHKFVTTGTVAMVLLASGNKDYQDLVETVAQRFIESTENEKSIASSWNLVYMGTFLCEYYLATLDKKALPAIERVSKLLADRTSENGRHGHGTDVGYDGKGINIITSHIMLVWALAEKCGIEIDEDAWDRSFEHCEKCSKPHGGLSYIFRSGYNDGSGRTGQYATALMLKGGEYKARAIKGSEYLAVNCRRNREAHASALLGMLWAPAAMELCNKKDLQTHAEYWTWYYSLQTLPMTSKDKVVYYIGSKRNNGGDSNGGYLHTNPWNHAVQGMFYAIGKKNLFVHGNKKMGWYKNAKSSIPYGKIPDIHVVRLLKRNAEDLVDSKELPKALKFLLSCKKRKGEIREVATDAYAAFTKLFDQKLADWQKMQYLRPMESYSKALKLQITLKRYPYENKAQLETLTKELKSKALVNLREKVKKYNSRYKKGLFSINKKTQAKTYKMIQDMFAEYMMTENIPLELREEAQLILTDITKLYKDNNSDYDDGKDEYKKASEM